MKSLFPAYRVLSVSILLPSYGGMTSTSSVIPLVGLIVESRSRLSCPSVRRTLVAGQFGSI